MTEYATKDSGQREEYASGMVRDTQANKPRFDLMLPLDVPYGEQLLTRIAQLMARGAEKYGDRNWEKGAGQEELERAKASAFRHFMQWLAGERDEDHAAAVYFNLMQVERLVYKLGRQDKPDRVKVAEVMAQLGVPPSFLLEDWRRQNGIPPEGVA